MKVSVVSEGEVSRTLDIEVPAESVAREYESVYARLSRSADQPGFRKGKVPRPLLEPRLRASVLRGVLENLLPRVTHEAITSQALKAVGSPAIEDLKYDGQGPLSFKAVVEVKPEFKLGAVEGLALTGPSGEVAEAEVDEQLEALRRRAAKTGGVKDGPAASGDWIKVDFQGFIDGKPFSGGQATDYALVLGRKQLIPGFEEQLTGAGTGESRQVKVDFPSDYPAQDVAGKAAEFIVVVKEVRLLELPELDDSFAKTFGPDVTSVTLLRERLREALAEQKRRARLSSLMDAAADALLRLHSFSVPPSLIEAEARVLEQGELGRLAGQGMELNGEQGRAAMLKALREPAERRARLSLVLEKIAESRNIADDEADFEAEMARLAAQMKASSADAARLVRQNGREQALRAQIRERKALQWVVDKAKAAVAA